MGTYIKTDKDIKIYVEDLGEGTPVLFIHGWPLNHSMYEYQLNELPRYGIRCILMDLRGFGRSDRPWNGYSYDRMADDIYQVIETMRLRDIVLAGFSMGGAICVRYMARHRGHKVSKLMLFGAAAPVFTQHPDYLLGHTADYINGLIAKACSDRPALVDEISKQFFHPSASISPPFQTWLRSLALEAAGHATIKCAESLRDEDCRADVKLIHVPTAIFHGTEDRICPFPLAKELHQHLESSELIAFEHSGHGLFYEEKEKFNQELLQFVRKTGKIRSRIGKHHPPTLS